IRGIVPCSYYFEERTEKKFDIQSSDIQDQSTSVGGDQSQIASLPGAMLSFIQTFLLGVGRGHHLKEPQTLKACNEGELPQALNGPHATKFWTTPTPSYSEHGKEEAVIINNNNHKCK
ncbi:MAG: hypothetical protein Q9198_008898, partial [Flavoplaca austrocitrina]